MRVDSPLLQRIIQQCQHLLGMQRARSGCAHDAADQSGIERGGRGLAAGISQSDAGAMVVIVQEIVHIAADGARRQKARCKFRGLMLGKRLRKQAKLNLARHFEIMFQTLFLLCDTLVEPRIFNGDRDLGG